MQCQICSDFNPKNCEKKKNDTFSLKKSLENINVYIDFYYKWYNNENQ